MEAIIVDDRDIIQETSAVKWIESHQVEAEQLAMDAARLLSCTEDRLEDIKKQGFFSRCWNRLTGKARKMDQATKEDLVHIQKNSMQYLSILQNNCEMLAQDMVTLKNQLLGLSLKEEETRTLIAQMAYRTAERFKELESKMGQIEISSNLQGWIIGLEERDYDELYPNKYSRMFRVINDFYSIKNDNWSYNDIILMRKALRLVDINPKEKITLDSFISSIVDEIEEIGINNYSKSVCEFNNTNIEYSNFAVDNISSPIFTSIHNLNIQYIDKNNTIKALRDVVNISMSEALKRLLKSSITNLNINLNYEFPLIEAAIEVLGCLRLVDKLKNKEVTGESVKEIELKNEVTEEVDDESQLELVKKYVEEEEYTKALNILKPLADRGYAPAHRELGLMYRDGIGTIKNDKTAEKFLKFAADSGDIEAQAELADLYSDEESSIHSYSKAAQLYQMAANQGDILSHLYLGDLYRDGKGVQKSYSNAKKHYEMCLKDKENAKCAQCNLGILYRHGGFGVTQDYHKAAILLEQSSNNGYDWGSYFLSILYDKGLGVYKNYEKSISLLKKSAEQGNDLAKKDLYAIDADCFYKLRSECQGSSSFYCNKFSRGFELSKIRSFINSINSLGLLQEGMDDIMDRVLLYYDDTTFGGGDEGFLITNKYTYVIGLKGSVRFSNKNVACRIDISDGYIHFYSQEHDDYLTSGGYIKDKQQIASILNEYYNNLK